jgi:hypothetical protein
MALGRSCNNVIRGPIVENIGLQVSLFRKTTDRQADMPSPYCDVARRLGDVLRLSRL